MQYIRRTFYRTTASNGCVSLPLDICITNPEHWIKIGEDHPLWAYTIKNVKNHMTLSDDQKLEDLFKEEMIKSE